MADLNIGIIGPGSIAGEKLAPALARVPDAVLWGVAGRDHGKALDFARRFGAVGTHPGFGDWRTMIRCADLDAVIIATPDRFHAPMAVAALEEGKHVFIEKPMATSVGEAMDIRKAATASGKTVAVGYHHRFHAGHLALRERIVAGDLGAVTSFRGVWRYPSEDGWRNAPDTGRWWSLAAVGTHLIDLAWFMLGPVAGPVVETACMISAPRFRRHDETAAFQMRFDGGAVAEISVSVHGPARRGFEIVGTEAAAEAHWTLGGSGAGPIHIDHGMHREHLMYDPVDPYAAELADFVDAVRDGSPPSAGLDAGTRNVEWLCRTFG